LKLDSTEMGRDTIVNGSEQSKGEIADDCVDHRGKDEEDTHPLLGRRSEYQYRYAYWHEEKHQEKVHDRENLARLMNGDLQNLCGHGTPLSIELSNGRRVGASKRG
jgi:hypothetical protein